MVSAAHLLIRNEVENIRECFWEATTGITCDHANEKESIESINKLPAKSKSEILSTIKNYYNYLEFGLGLDHFIPTHLTRAGPPLSPLQVPAWLSSEESAQNKGSLQS